MRRTKFSSIRTVHDVCKEIEELCPKVLRGVKPIKEKKDKTTYIYYPALKFSFACADMDGVKIIVRKVNNSLTSIKLEDEERYKGTAYETNRRYIVPKETYDILKEVMTEKYAQ